MSNHLLSKPFQQDNLAFVVSALESVDRLPICLLLSAGLSDRSFLKASSLYRTYVYIACSYLCNYIHIHITFIYIDVIMHTYMCHSRAGLVSLSCI